METILECINSLRDEMRAGFDRFESELRTLRADMNDGFRRLERKVDLLNRDILDIRGDNEYVLQRVEKLESKVQ